MCVVLPEQLLCDLQQGLVGHTALVCRAGGRNLQLLWLPHQLMQRLSAVLHAGPGTDKEEEKSRVVSHSCVSCLTSTNETNLNNTLLVHSTGNIHWKNKHLNTLSKFYPIVIFITAFTDGKHVTHSRKLSGTRRIMQWYLHGINISPILIPPHPTLCL